MNTTLNRIIFVFCFFCFFQAVSVQGQPVFFDVQKATEQYPDESFIILKREDQFSITVQNGSLKVFRHRTEQYLYLKNMAAFNTERSLQSSSFVPLKTYKANTYLPNGTKFRKVPVKNVAIKNTSEGSIFFDDEKEYVFTFPSIERGAVLEIESTHEIAEPRFFPTLFFQSVVPVYSLDYSIECDTSVVLQFAEFNMKNIDISYSKDRSKKGLAYRWSGQNIMPIKDEPNQPSVRYFIAHTIPFISRYRTENGEEKTFLSSVDDLYSWYYTFVDGVNPPETYTALAPLADSITLGKTTDFEKAKAIFYWVQANIKYIAFEDGMGGLVPRNALDVYKKRYGDCKDKTSLLKVLMRHAGLDAYFCWIGSDELPYSYRTVYSPTTDNHMILAVNVDDTMLFLDGTGSFQNIHLPTRFIQGKEGLIAIDKDHFLIETVPTIPAEQNNVSDSVLFQIGDRGQLSGTGHYSLSGYSKLYFQNSLIGKSNSEQKNIIDEYVEIGNNKCILTSYQMPSIATYDSSLSFHYTISIDDYCHSFGDELFINTNMYQDWIRFQIPAERQTPMKFKFASSFQFTFCIEIPDGYRITYLPANSQYTDGPCSYTISYSIAGRLLTYKHAVSVDSKLIPPEQFEQWREFIGKLKSDYRQSVSMERQ